MNYRNETLFRFYTSNNNELLIFIEEIGSLGFELQSVISDEENYTDFDRVIKDGIDSGLIINLNQSSHINVTSFNADITIYLVSFYFEWGVNIERCIFDFIKESQDIMYSYLTNYYDVKWQKETSIQSYKANNKGVSNLILTVDIFDEPCVDISKNYGREFKYGDYLIVAAYCSWFKTAFIESVLNMQHSVFFEEFECRELDNGLLQLKLFSKINDNYYELRDRQRNFLNYLGVQN